MNRVRLAFPVSYIRLTPARGTHNHAWTCNTIVHGQNLNAAREVACESDKGESDVCPGMAGCEPEVVVSQTSIGRRHSSEGVEASEVRSRQKPSKRDTFLDEGDPTRPLSGSWSRAGMLTTEYDSVNSRDEPYGRKEGSKDDLRYGCMEKYKRESAAWCNCIQRMFLNAIGG
ncbi:hypothetical protein AX14_010321 [Amanita brunnescens Koide BX004]|nr:hypothetical protein AX14_010321 [Amanita brunnescens Koide BX004]